MAELARGGKSVFMVANVIRFWPEYEFLNECVATGMLGKLEALSFTRVSPRPAWGWKGWSTDAKRSGGALLDLHIHDTDLILHLLGEPAAVDSCGVKIRGAWDYVTTNYHYQHAAVSALGGWNLPDSASFKMAYRAIFENGVLDYDITREPTVMVYRQGKKPEAPAVRRPRIAPRAGIGNISAMEGYYNELRYFVDCVRDGVPADRSNVASALLTLEWIYREMESAARKLR
jgi:predicted dehydrogenase